MIDSLWLDFIEVAARFARRIRFLLYWQPPYWEADA